MSLLKWLIVTAAVQPISYPGQASAADDLLLWYRHPAQQWTEALPVGNGRLGAMVFGGLDKERLQLNENTFWSGGPYDPDNPEALAALPEARRLIFDGKYTEARDLIGKRMMGVPLRQMSYQPIGDLVLEFAGHEKATGYRRELNLDTAIASTRYRVNSVGFRREVFASANDFAIIVRLTADKPGQLNFVAKLTTPQQKLPDDGKDHRDSQINGIAPGEHGIKGATRFSAQLHAIADGGEMTVDPEQTTVAGANSVTLLVSIATSYVNYHDAGGDAPALAASRLVAAAGMPYEKLRRDHIAEHQRLFRRVAIDLGRSEAADRPTDERLKSFADGKDPQLAALMFQYGRYLLISSSTPGGQPATLQGLWNDRTDPPWGSKYTININTEMNYWPAEVTNLAECHEPLFRLIRELVEPGSRTARVHYGAGGWVCHHNTDIWRATAPCDGPHAGMWPCGGAWLCKHLWDHYEFSGDRDFLRDAYPTMRGAAQFFLDALVEEPTHHWLVTCPSLSPENEHHRGVKVCAGPTMDIEIIGDLFDHTIQATEILGIDPELRERITATKKRLPPLQIGRLGQLQEWLDDWDNPTNHHRHVSHLYALFPSEQITRSTPNLFAAAQKSLELRGDGGTGWSKAWKINWWARLGDGDHAYRMLEEAIVGNTYPNLFDAHPPFQIDGNFGATSGIAEMLLQSQSGEISLLPALPKAWPNGSVTGMRARGGAEVDLAWRDGQFTSATLKPSHDGPQRIRLPQNMSNVEAQREGKAIETAQQRDGALEIDMHRGQSICLRPLPR